MVNHPFHADRPRGGYNATVAANPYDDLTGITAQESGVEA